VLLIIFFVFLGCSLSLIFKKDDSLPFIKRIWVQFVALCFGSLVLTGVFLGWDWNKWFVWVLGIPAGLYIPRALRLIFDQAEGAKDIDDLIDKAYNTYKTVRGKKNDPQP